MNYNAITLKAFIYFFTISNTPLRLYSMYKTAKTQFLQGH